MTTRAEFAATVLAYEDTPYLHQGRLAGAGMDCAAPLICGARAHRIVPPDWDFTGYSPHPDGVTLQALCDQHLLRVAGAPRLADVLLCAFGTGLPCHLGILVDATPGRMYWLHAENVAHHRVRRDRLVFGVRAMRLVAAYAVPGLED